MALTVSASETGAGERVQSNVPFLMSVAVDEEGMRTVDIFSCY